MSDNAERSGFKAFTGSISSAELSKPGASRSVSVRVSPGSYLAVSFILTFAAIIVSRNEFGSLALALLTMAWPVTLSLAFFDRVVFDGRKLSRTGIVALVSHLRGRRLELSVDQIERVETSAVRTLRSAGRVRYRYRCETSSESVTLVFASGGQGFRRMVRLLFPLIGDEKLDARSCDLRDYLTDQKSLNSALEAVHLAPSSVLEESEESVLQGVKNNGKRTDTDSGQLSERDAERGHLLRLLANQLRVMGRLRESSEAFRRAFLLLPREGGLLYEYSRLLRSRASAAGDARLLSRSRAALRLAIKRAGDNASVLERAGESLVEAGDARIAEEAFRRTLNLNPRSFRAATGLAEVALRRGQLAHIIHHFRNAQTIATDKASRRFAAHEAEYYARLCEDDEYMLAEMKRIKWLHHLNGARRTLVRTTFAALLLAVAGSFFDEALASVGWSIASGALAAWMMTAAAIKLLLQRRKLRES